MLHNIQNIFYLCNEISIEGNLLIFINRFKLL